MLAVREGGRILRHILGRHHALLHVHIDGRIADDHGLVAAAIDIAYLRGRNDVDARVGLGETVEAGFNQGIVHGRLVVLVNAVKGRVAGFLELFLGARRPIRIISVDGIGSLVAAAVQFVDDDGLASVLYDVDGDGAAHVAALVIAADHLAIDTVSDGQDDVVVDVGIRVAAEYLGHVVHALHQHLGLSVDEGFVAAAVGMVNLRRAVGGRLVGRHSQDADVTLDVAAAVGVVYAAAIDFGVRLARTVGIVGDTVLLVRGVVILDGLVGFRLCSLAVGVFDVACLSDLDVVGVVLVAHVGARVLVPLAVAELVVVIAVAAAEELVYLIASVDVELGGRRRGSVAVAIHLLDAGHLTTVDDYLRKGCGLRGLIVREGVRREI